MSEARRRLILFTRYPTPGQAKTRLISALGPEGAAALHRRLVLRTLRTAIKACRAVPADLEVRFEGEAEQAMSHSLGDSALSPTTMYWSVFPPYTTVCPLRPKPRGRNPELGTRRTPCNTRRPVNQRTPQKTRVVEKLALF